MIGKYHIEISNKKIKYELDVKRKYTIISGDRVEVIRLTNHESVYTTLLKTLSNKIFVIDENIDLLDSVKFSKLLIESDNYFIITSREGLSYLPISMREEYTLKQNKYNNVRNQFENILVPTIKESDFRLENADLIIVEDKKSGFSCDIL